MLKAIIFDFDGVILESTEVKIDAFRELFSAYPDLVDEIVAYHIEHGGISRFVKFRHIYQNMLHKELTPDEEKRLGERFTELALDKVLTVPYVEGAREFLENRRADYLFFVASGTPQEELSIVVEKRGMQHHFDGIYGSPQTKKDIIEMLRERHDLRTDEVLFVGDAHSDRLAAREAGVDFVFRTYDGEADPMDKWVLRNLERLDELIEQIEL